MPEENPDILTPAAATPSSEADSTVLTGQVSDVDRSGAEIPNTGEVALPLVGVADTRLGRSKSPQAAVKQTPVEPVTLTLGGNPSGTIPHASSVTVDRSPAMLTATQATTKQQDETIATVPVEHKKQSLPLTPPPGNLDDQSAVAAGSFVERRVSNTYTIKPGDTFISIAIARYGSELRWVEIAQANQTVDPIKLQVGQVIRLPEDQQVSLAKESASVSQPPSEKVNYLVRPGDTLSSIAKEYYNDVNNWRVIYNTNRSVIGPNPDRIPVGQPLQIPPPLVTAQQ